MNGYGQVKRPGVLAVALIGLLAATAGCATANVGGQPVARSKADPYESINRKIFQFNDKVDDYIAEPIADAYLYITPQFVQTGIFNFYNNLENINVVINNLLQGKFRQGARDTGRLLVNSSLGLLGLVDVAQDLGLPQTEEDFDQTLAVWGVPRGPYLVLPFLGPTTVRGVPGMVFDVAANPASYVGAPVQLLALLNARANAEGAMRFIDEAALDRYLFTRESFLQWRQNLAYDGRFQPLDHFEYFEDDLAETNGGGYKAERFTEAARVFDSVVRSFESTATVLQGAADKAHALKGLWP